MALYRRFVQIGRVVLINYGPFKGKLAVILDVIDQNRALVDGPLTGVPRHQIPFRRVTLTDFKIAIPKGAREKTLKAAYTKADVTKKFAATKTGLKLAQREKRASATDFDRFKIRTASTKKNLVIRTALGKLKREYNKKNPKIGRAHV